jgi:oxygen-dependent protoporphyrinogen oxidase
MAAGQVSPGRDGARVVVVGGGIAGLAAAWELASRLPTAQVVLLEAAAEVGGKLRVAELAGIPVDVGAEALLARRPEGVQLIHAAGLGASLIAPLTTAAGLRAGGVNRRLPAGTMMGIPADLVALRKSGVLGAQALARVTAEESLPAMAALTADVSVGELVRDRLGDEVLERLVEPLLGGVYAGRADELSLAATMPALAARLRACGGSLVAAARTVTDVGTRAPASISGPDTAPAPVFNSLTGGLGTLALALAASGKFTVRTGVTVRSVRRTASGLALECGPVPEPELVEADGVVLAVPAAKAATLLADVAVIAATELSQVQTASMAIVSLAYRDVAPPPGSGLLIGVGEGFAVKAVTLSSQKWPGTPAGLTVLRASLGRAGETRDLQRPDAELVGLVRGELGRLIGVTDVPVDALVTRWGGGLPQYGVGHVELVARIRASVASVAGLAVCGATYDGVGVPACISSARLAVEQVISGLPAIVGPGRGQ